MRDCSPQMCAGMKVWPLLILNARHTMQVNGVAKFTNLMIETASRAYHIQYLAGPTQAPLQVCMPVESCKDVCMYTYVYIHHTYMHT